MIIATHRLNLRLKRPGTLLPWLGPALRGAVAIRFKDRVCQQPAEQRERWIHCSGCQYMSTCSYGQTYEPDPPAGAGVLNDQPEVTRPLVLAPYFPVPDLARPGLDVPLRICVVGVEAVRHTNQLLEALADAGRTGLGSDRVTFDLIENGNRPDVRQLQAADLPPSPDVILGVLPRVGIGLTAPLFLTVRDTRGKRQPIETPQFADLFRASLRTVGRMFAHHDQPLPADFAALKAAAEHVRLLEDCYEPFTQRKWSSRGSDRFELQGVIGGGVYGDVPQSLLPWLTWGGNLHVGTHRVAGAGGWRIVLD